MSIFQMAISIVGGLAFFLFGMKVMSEGLQKVAGAKMRKFLSAITDNRFFGVGTGLVVTSAIQSSSATTVMLVGFVNAGLITLTQSIGVIMGANIGTTFTGWLVALLGFKVKIAALALPAVAIGFFVRFFGSRKLSDWGEVLIGFGVLFVGLGFMKDSVSELKESATLLAWMSSARADTLTYRLVAVAVGTLVTIVVQSSSATMAITMTLAAEGMIDLPTACALVLGENIGTTITANIAAVGTSVTARRAARAHFLFNIIGVVWAVLLFMPFLTLVDAIVPGSAGLTGQGLSKTEIAARLAMFHSLFNVINTGLFLSFATHLARLATLMVRERAGAGGAGLKFLDTKILGTPPLALHAARNEFLRMVDKVRFMLDNVMILITTSNGKTAKIAEQVEAAEQTVDMLEKEITEYLVSIAMSGTSKKQSAEIAGLINAVGDVERVGDHCESLLKLATRMRENNIPFNSETLAEVQAISDKVKGFLALLRANILDPSKQLMDRANEIERAINDMRKKMRQAQVAQLQNGTREVESGLVFIDMLTSFEKIGDHSFNVAQMLAGER